MLAEWGAYIGHFCITLCNLSAKVYEDAPQKITLFELQLVFFVIINFSGGLRRGYVFMACR